MRSSTPPPSSTAPRDEDLVEQALPGHGVPSQDPDPAAQIAQDPEAAEHEATSSAMTGGGALGGAAIGASVGAAVAGPVGVVVGATVGAVAGAAGGAATGTMKRPDETSGTDSAPGDTAATHSGKAAARRDVTP